jgi:hypothetical protein
MTPELVTYILTVSLGIVVGLALMAFYKESYIRWLVNKLATTRQELVQLQNDRQQPWLQGATTEYHLQKKIKELEQSLSKKMRCPHCGNDSRRGY